MGDSWVNAILGTLVENGILVYVMARLLDIKKDKVSPLLGFAFLWTVLSIVLQRQMPEYSPFVIFPLFLVGMRQISKESFFKVFFTFLIFTLLMLVIQLPLVPVYHLLGESLMGLLVVLSIVAIAFQLILYKWEGMLKYHIQKYENRYINYLALNMVLFIFLFKIVYDFDQSILVENFGYFFLLMGLVLFINYYIYREVALISERNKLLEVQDEIRAPLEHLISEVKSNQHEYKNHLNTILGILETSSADAASERIKGYLTDINDVELVTESLIHVGRDIVKAVLFVKHNEAVAQSIPLYIKIQSDFSLVSMLDYELSIVMNNLINNALEAVENEAVKDVLVELGYDEEKKKHYILTGNHATALDLSLIGKFAQKEFTTKEVGGEKRGFGLWNVNNILKKYQGGLEVQVQKNKLLVKAYF